MTATQAIDQFATLKPGWDGYQAPPPNEVAIGLASEIVRSIDAGELPSLLSADCRIVPSVVGGIGMTFRTRHINRRAYVEIYNDGDVGIVLSEDSGDGEDMNPWSDVASRGNRSFRELLAKAERHLGK